MGTIFPLIEDSALRAEDADYYTECQVCSKRAVSVYPCQGYLVAANGEPDKIEDRYVACAPCLKLGRVAHIDEHDTDPVLDAHAKRPAEAKMQLRSTPRVPCFVQGTDWPLCCGELTIFIGSPNTLQELIAAQTEGSEWRRGEVRQSKHSYQAAIYGPPESLRNVSLFRCERCNRLLWVFQRIGFFLPSGAYPP